MNVGTTSRLASMQRVAAVIATLGFAALLAGAFVAPVRAFTSLLVGAVLVLGLSVGAMLVLSLNAVSGAGWATVLKRVFEAMGSFLPVAALLLLATTPGLRVLYEWARPEASADHLLHMKAAYLNAPFFMGRMALVLGAWILFSVKLRGLSRAQDDAPDEGTRLALTRRTAAWSAGFIVVFAVTFCMAAFDWLMSLDARWFSTIFGLYNIAGVLVSTVTAVAMAAVLLRRAGILPEVGRAHLLDLGRLMFAFSTLWAYLWFSQFLLIWYSNIPEETVYFEQRWQGGWTPVFLGNLIINWVLPFFLLLPREAKRSERHLLRVGALLLVGRFVDLYLMAAPANAAAVPVPGLLELAGFAAPLALFVFWVTRTWARVPLLPVNDPYLPESLHHHG